MTEENKSLQTPQNEPEPEAEPVDTAAAMQYFEASEAAAEVGREILASRKPKKQKQKKPKKQKSPVRQEPETAPAPEPVEEPAEQPAPEATETNGWQPSQREEPAAEPAAEPAPAEPQESPESQEPKAPKKPKKKKKKSRPKQGKKAPAKAKNAKPREKRPTLAESFESMERGCAYIGMQLLREYYAIRRGIGHVYGRVRARVPILWRSLRFKVVRRTEHFADEVLFPYRILHDETAELAAALRDKTPEGKAGRREAWRDYSRAVARPLNRIANFFAPIFGLAILAGAIAFFNHFPCALREETNGDSIVNIAQESDFYYARDAML